MPGRGVLQVKCEPASDDDESQFAHSFLSNQIPSLELRAVKLEPEIDNNASAHILHHLQGSEELEELAPPAPSGPTATPVCVKQEPAEPAVTLETLAPAPHCDTMGATLIDRHKTLPGANDADSMDFMPLLAVKDEPLSEGEQQHLSGSDTSDSSTQPELTRSPKNWTQQDMQLALEALRKHNMSLTKASATYGIPSTTLWQRAHRLGIDTPKKEGASKSWSETDLRGALNALRSGAISANKASKAYGIPSSTLYKIARREGIRLAAPFNAAPTAWRRADLERALAAIRAGACSVQRAAAQFGIPTGTLYGRCKREGIELSRSNPTPWSEDAMGEALEAVRVGQMSINQAAIHYNLPYSSLYGRFKRCKYQSPQTLPQQAMPENMEMEQQSQSQEMYYQHQNVPVNQGLHPEQDLQNPYLQQNYVMSDPGFEAMHSSMLAEQGYGMYYQGCSSIATS
ncbi:BTB-domain-containing protein pipsqueak isoform X2 [Choristoneura fumiferana]